MKIYIFYLLLTLFATVSNCRTFATSHNDIDESSQLEELLAFVEYLAKELKQAVFSTVEDIEDCHPIMDGQYTKTLSPTKMALSNDYSWENESCLWDKLKELVGVTFDTIKYLLKKILGFGMVARDIQLSYEAYDENRTVVDQLQPGVHPLYELLKMDKEENENMAKRIEAVLKSVEVSFQLMICYLHHEDADRD